MALPEATVAVKKGCASKLQIDPPLLASSLISPTLETKVLSSNPLAFRTYIDIDMTSSRSSFLPLTVAIPLNI